MLRFSYIRTIVSRTHASLLFEVTKMLGRIVAPKEIVDKRRKSNGGRDSIMELEKEKHDHTVSSDDTGQQ